MQISDTQVFAAFLRELADQIEGDKSCYISAHCTERERSPIYFGVQLVDGVVEPVVVNHSPRTITIKAYVHLPGEAPDQAGPELQTKVE
ncbi:hypothetical protein WH367_19345 [Comamonas sp. MYb21]|uniref:hypothetical protein n=1 Tax=Comamonas sp. MYb21 TaxID=1848648 RepID=UPI003097A559